MVLRRTSSIINWEAEEEGRRQTVCVNTGHVCVWDRGGIRSDKKMMLGRKMVKGNKR